MGYRQLLILGFAFITVGCAAQKAYLNSNRSEDLVMQASKLSPLDPDTERAKISLEAGQIALGQARFGLAERKFKEAELYASKVIDSQNPSPDQQNRALRDMDPRDFSAQDDTASAQAVDRRVPDPSQEGLIGRPDPQAAMKEARQDLEKKQKKSLPANALAQYLQNKSANPPTEVATAAAGAVAAASAAPVPQKLPPQKTLIEEPTKDPNKQGNLPPPTLEDETAKNIEVIEAPSEATAKVPPVVPADPEPESLAAVVPAPASKKKEKEREMRKMPAVVVFPPKEEALNDSAMAELDKVSRFLVKNPSNTLVFKAIKGPNEGDALVEDRYQSVVSYLAARGVPEDQVRLSGDRTDGRSASFELFLIEH